MSVSRTCFIGTLCLVLFSGLAKTGHQAKGVPATEPPAPVPTSAKIAADYGKMPAYFIPNRGQLTEQVAYYIQGTDKTIYFTSGGLTLALARGGADGRYIIKLDFVGADHGVRPVGQDETGGVISYFRGKPEEWRTGLPICSKILYRDLWPGIDLAYYGTVNKLKYEFIVHPGADPSAIRLAYRGAEGLAVDDAGRLEVMTPAGNFRDDVPMAYQYVRGEKPAVPLDYELYSARQTDKSNDPKPAPGRPRAADGDSGRLAFGFTVGAYDSSRDLVLDPAILVYCGFIGGSDGDFPYGIATDGSGNAYVGRNDLDPSHIPGNGWP